MRVAGLPKEVICFGGPSLVTGLLTDCDLLGGVVGLSAVFDADDVVGRIIRARKPSSAGALDGRLCREGCFFNVPGGGPREGLLLPLLSVEGLRVNVDFVVVVLARLGERVEAWCAWRELVDVMFPDARLRDCRGGGTAPVAVFEPDEAVCAVKEAGSLTGLVGDLGLGLWNPV